MANLDKGDNQHTQICGTSGQPEKNTANLRNTSQSEAAILLGHQQVPSNHDADKLWAKKKAQGLPGLEAPGLGPNSPEDPEGPLYQPDGDSTSEDINSRMPDSGRSLEIFDLP